MAGPIKISILANGAQARREAAVTSKAFAGMGRSLARGGAALGLTGLAAGIAGVAKRSVDLEAKFSQTMNTIAAATGATGGQITKLNDLAIKLGADTSYSANEAADAMLELAKAGITTRDIIGGSLAGTLQLAAAGGTELGTAATIASNAMNAFSLRGKDMASIAAALAGGANASSASVESLGQGLQQVGAGAVNAGLSLQQTVGVLSAFDAAGIKGSDAGTSLKTMLTRLVPSTTAAQIAMDDLNLRFVNADGSFRGIASVAEQLRKRLGGLSQEQRTQALATIFGSDATRAATVLMRQGADGTRKFIKATRDQGAAQKMADARMKGTAGALERLSGAAETAQLRLGQELAPMVQKTADVVGDNLGPAMDAVIDNAKTFGRAVEPLVDVLEGAGKAALGTAKFLNGLPGPVKEFGIQAGVAALVVPRLAGAVTGVTGAVSLNIKRLQQLRAELTYTETRSQIASGAMGRLGGAMKSAAGIGGMALLISASNESNAALASLKRQAGLTATAFSLGGPWAGAVTAFVSIVGEARAAGEDLGLSQQALAGQVRSVTDALNEQTGAFTKSNRDALIRTMTDQGMLKSAQDLGLGLRGMTKAVLGGDEAVEAWRTRALRVAPATNEAGTAVIALAEKMYDLTAAYQDGQAAWAREREAAGKAGAKYQRVRESVQALSKTYDRTPKQVRTIVKAVGTDGSLKNVRTLARQYDLTPKQVRTIFRAVGAARLRGDAKGVGKAVENAGKVRPSSKWVEWFRTDVGRGKREAARGAKSLADLLRAGTGKAKPNLAPFNRQFTGTIDGLKPKASAGGSQIGGNLGAGIYGGVDVWAGPIASRAAGIVRQAVAAAKAEAKIKSPSRVMRDEVGAQLGAGLVLGLRAKEGAAARAGRSLMSSVLREVVGGRDGVKDALTRITRVIGKRKGLLASYRDEYAALRRNGRAQDRTARQLERAEDRLKRLRQAAKEYRNTIRDSVVSYGSVVGLGAVDGSTSVVSLKGLLSQLTARADAAKRWGQLITKLRTAGLNKTSIQQLLDAGVEGGLATAEAIASGGASAIAQINQLTAQIGSTGTKLGDKMTKAYHQAGIRAAEGLVRGLEKRQKQLDKVAERLAQSLVTKVKKQLGIKSPSRVFQGIGTNVMDGLALTLNDTHSRRMGSNLASGLVGGFGTPSLDAYYAGRGPAGAGSSQPLRVHFTAQEVSQLQRGREIIKDVDYFLSSGGRSRTLKVG